MISEITPQRIIQEQFVGLSTDEKPTNVFNGSVFLEMDTGAVYLFDAEKSEWIALGDSQVSGVVPSDPGETSTK